jgi:hypothetical protein
MKSVAVSELAGLGTEPEALIKEARRRQRRRYLAAGAAVAAVLGSAAGIAAGLHAAGNGHAGRPRPRSHPRSPAAARQLTRGPAPIPRSAGTTLLMWPVGYPGFTSAGGPPLYADDLSTGRLTQSGAVAISAGDFQPLLVRTGRWLVYVANGTAAIRDNLRGEPRALGSTPFFAPAATPGHVWLFSVRHGQRGHFRIEARLVPVADGPPGPPVTLPAGAYLPAIEGTDEGLVLQTRQGLALWNPGARPRTLPYSPDISDGFDATPRLVAYGTGCGSQATAQNAPYEPNAGYDTCHMLRVFDVVTGTTTSFPAPPGTGGWVPNGFDLVNAISPRGQLIAAYAATLPQGTGHVRLYVLRTTRPARRPIPVPRSTAFIFARTAWSANDAWLFYQGPGQHLWGYQVTSGKIRASSTPCCRYTVMTAAPSHSG